MNKFDHTDNSTLQLNYKSYRHNDGDDDSINLTIDDLLFNDNVDSLSLQEERMEIKEKRFTNSGKELMASVASKQTKTIKTSEPNKDGKKRCTRVGFFRTNES